MKRLLLCASVILCLLACAFSSHLTRRAWAQRSQAGSNQATSPQPKTDSAPVSTANPANSNSSSSNSNPIPASFFAMNVSESEDYPSLPIGTLGHPAALAWSRGELSRGNYRWVIFDGFVEEARRHGLVDSNNVVNIVLTLGMTPGWAVSEARNCNTNFGLRQCADPPDNIDDWRDFVTALVDHYNGKTAPHIKYYELWNEVTGNYWKAKPEDLVKLAEVAYPIVHRDPYSVLLAPSAIGVATGPDTHATGWIASYLRAGGAKYADGGTFHGYLGTRLVVPFPMPEQDETPGCGAEKWAICAGSILTQIRNYRAVFDENGLAGKPMFNTEGSWGPDTITDPDLQSAWVARYFLLQAGVASEDNLQFVSWFSWGRPRGERKPWGQLETETGAPNQAAHAYQQVREWILNASITPCEAKGTVWSCNLTRANGYEAMAVWDTSQTCSDGSCGTTAFSPDHRFTQIRTLSGEKSKLGASVRIGAKPVLLENR